MSAPHTASSDAARPAPEANDTRAEVPRAPLGVVDAIAVLRGEGYTLDFDIGQGCPGCEAIVVVPAVSGLEFDQVFRFEGASDPDDEAIVFGLRCPACGGLGVLVSAYGAGAPDAAAIVALVDRRATEATP